MPLPANVELTNTLFDGNVAYEEQQIIFTCTTTGLHNFLTWSSDHYLDQPLQISFHDELGHQESSPQNPSTVATLVDATTNGGVTVIVSQLQITASMQNSISNVSCQMDNNGVMGTITFSKELFAWVVGI